MVFSTLKDMIVPTVKHGLENTIKGQGKLCSNAC